MIYLNTENERYSLKLLGNTIKTKGNNVLGWSVVQFIAEGCFGYKEVWMGSISILAYYQKKSMLRATSTTVQWGYNLPPVIYCQEFGSHQPPAGSVLTVDVAAVHWETYTAVCWTADLTSGTSVLMLWGIVLQTASSASRGSPFLIF